MDLYNRLHEPRALEAFVIHMHLAWLYLLHAELTRDNIDFRYWDRKRGKRARLVKVNDEPKTWELSRCVEKRWKPSDPVRKNIEFFVGLRDKIEHRYQEATIVTVAGHAQAHVLNYEAELVSQFGKAESLASVLRFPVFLTSLTSEGIEALKKLKGSLPPRVSRYIASFHDGLDPQVAQDERFEYRLRLMQYVGPASQADLAVEFVKWDANA